jgi:hypothetical protein
MVGAKNFQGVAIARSCRLSSKEKKVAGSDGVIVVLCVSCVVTEMSIASGRRTPSPFSASSLHLASRLLCLFLPSFALL